ncbi:hypothetical protein CERSUDRAFT_112860 [Gelatoporia subvermispora B]|uniref:RING-type domain-containing protein n=1 Tax=Ceriporiopsis subvermispora (strain B) TaxID=914234 RepID=M2RK35_CERS8|nr:hypothetical protein CERSUDRAFT_112860 [Gelatoporia subvermispora B]
MPPVANAPAPQRRVPTSSWHRENRLQQGTQTSGPSGRRRKSRSPDSRNTMPEDIALYRHSGDSGSTRKKKKHGSSSHAQHHDTSRPSSMREPQVDRGRTAKATSRIQSFFSEDGIVSTVLRDITRGGANTHSHHKKKERSKSRDATRRANEKAVATTPEPMDEDDDFQQSGAPGDTVSLSDYWRMREEVERLKKVVTKQSKVIDDLRKDMNKSSKSLRDRTQELEKLNSKTQESDELLANIESNLTCQICYEIVHRPFSLSPCGHVLCQTCLQDWFRKGPVSDDDLYSDDDIIHRKKTCPCCRSTVRSRPIPMFALKSVASLIEKAKAGTGPARPSPTPEDDPWEGIFRRPWHEVDDDWSDDGYDDPMGEDDEDEDEDEDDDEDEDYDDDDDDDDYWSFDGYGTGEDEGSYEGPYVLPHWAPPTVHVTPADFQFLDHALDAEDLAMLRRGATMEMINIFSMSYTHEAGLRAVVDNGNVVYLGWNIELHPTDVLGERYMDWVTSDIYEHPERWDVEESHNGSWTAWRRVPGDEDNEHYYTTDSEVWAAELEGREEYEF